MSLLIGDNDAIGVAVEGNADVGAHFTHFAAQRVGCRRTAFAVDIEAVGLDADRDDVGAQFPERVRCHPVTSAVSAIDHDAQAFEREVARQRSLGEFNVAVMYAVDPLGAAEFAAFGQSFGNVRVDQPLDVLLDLVGKFVAVRAEQLDAVVVKWVVRRRNHHAEIGAHGARQHGDGRRRHRPEQQHVHADRGEARDQRGLDHVTGKPRVLADYHPMAMLAAPEHKPGCLPGLERQLRCDHAIGAATNAVSAKILAGHDPHRLPFQAVILAPSS